MKPESFPSKRLLFAPGLLLLLLSLLWKYIPFNIMPVILSALGAFALLAAVLWGREQQRQQSGLANSICETMDALMDGREPENYHPYEDSQASKVQLKLMQFHDKLQEDGRQNRQDKQAIQELVSDISHQVKTPIANIQMFTNILQQHQLTDDKRKEFLTTMASQINKLDFLMQSLIKMSRLETGTFVLAPVEARLEDTIAQAMSTVWAKAENRHIGLSVKCTPEIMVQHDPKWTAEAIGNILDNAVKYTPAGGRISITVRPWQFYTRIEISDTGIGIPEEHYNHVFQRFYRAEEVATEEGVGLGLYLANGIITRQKGYISVKSKVGEGTTFYVYLLS